MARSPYFSRATFQFLKDLKANNDRDWFKANKDRYEDHVKTPALRLIQDFAGPLSGLSGHFQATPKSLFRIYRDTRFSKDKSPYKTAIGVHFRHERSKNAYAPGYYLHVAPGDVFAGMGIWHPESAALRQIREHIVAEPAAWKKVTGARKLNEQFRFEGDRLKRPPKGFDPEHPLIEDLKWKDFIAVRKLNQAFVTSADLPKELAKLFRSGKPLMGFLCDALGVPF